MANWCTNVYNVTGDREQLQKLYALMEEIESEKYDDGVNFFGDAWCGHLTKALGGDPMKDGCRGEWYNLELFDDYLTFNVESAWCEPKVWREFIERKFPGLKIYYQSKEPCNGYYVTNDDTGKWFSDKYYLEAEHFNGQLYYDDFDELAEDVEKITGKKGRTFEECEQIMNQYANAHDSWCDIGEFKLEV